ncbi:hypothetical protein NDN08_002799 [Rhodosorus marinus]|uniref:Uncharacterized protein n=1 Tax=Rhodosorus marinus TaxID=101924 RepID=A0AAV8UUQ5_9RHOD|nr:hypothetical protein NDN08_002799 [Rhodosorus marinus]
MNRISPKVLVLMLVAAVIYWRGGSSEAKEGEDARVVKIPAFPRNSSGSKESFPQQHVTCWCVRENVHCTVPQGLIAGSEKIVCNPVGGYDSIDEEHCRFEYDLYNPDTKFAVEVGERWKVDVEYGSAGTDDNWLGRGMPRTQTDLFKLMMRLTPGFGGHLHSMHHSMYSGNRGSCLVAR